MTSPSFKERVVLAIGKLRRLYYVFLKPGYVSEKLKQRKGECRRCGACCKLLFTCPFLDETNGTPTCKIHADKWKVCRLFPIDERDLRDRDIISPDKKCGYYFPSE